MLPLLAAALSCQAVFKSTADKLEEGIKCPQVELAERTKRPQVEASGAHSLSWQRAHRAPKWHHDLWHQEPTGGKEKGVKHRPFPR